jgi:hypothetical protein
MNGEQMSGTEMEGFLIVGRAFMQLELVPVGLQLVLFLIYLRFFPEPPGRRTQIVLLALPILCAMINGAWNLCMIRLMGDPLLASGPELVPAMERAVQVIKERGLVVIAGEFGGAIMLAFCISLAVLWHKRLLTVANGLCLLFLWQLSLFVSSVGCWYFVTPLVYLFQYR